MRVTRRLANKVLARKGAYPRHLREAAFRRARRHLRQGVRAGLLQVWTWKAQVTVDR